MILHIRFSSGPEGGGLERAFAGRQHANQAFSFGLPAAPAIAVATSASFRRSKLPITLWGRARAKRRRAERASFAKRAPQALPRRLRTKIDPNIQIRCAPGRARHPAARPISSAVLHDPPLTWLSSSSCSYIARTSTWRASSGRAAVAAVASVSSVVVSVDGREAAAGQSSTAAACCCRMLRGIQLHA